jgi:hypothetical protein
MNLEPRCANFMCLQPAVTDRMYCQKCSRKRLRAFRSELTGESGSTACGEPSEGSVTGCTTWTETEKSTTPSECAELRGTENVKMQLKESGTKLMSKTVEGKKSNEESAVIPSTGSTPLPRPAEEAKSISLSLIDESTQHLLELQRSIRAEAMENNLRADVGRIHAACNCAKQIASLQRLKIEAFKAMRK